MAEASLPEVSQPGPYSDKNFIPFPFIYNLSLSLNSFSHVLNRIRISARATFSSLVT